MADEVILSWNMTNWITVVVMVFLGFLIVGLVAQMWHKSRAASNAAV